MPGHIVLLGDSIFDNAVYVPGGPSVIEHLRRMLPRDWQGTLAAVDGAVVSSVSRQIERIPSDATHLVLSIGGNNALQISGPLHNEADSVGAGLEQLTAAMQTFATEYRNLVCEMRALHKPLAICTIYDAIPGLSAAERGGLCLFNDVITRTAFAANATLIDLRTICHEVNDYSTLSPIEPSAAGGGKIVRAIIDALFSETAASRVIA